MNDQVGRDPWLVAPPTDLRAALEESYRSMSSSTGRFSCTQTIPEATRPGHIGSSSGNVRTDTDRTDKILGATFQPSKDLPRLEPDLTSPDH